MKKLYTWVFILIFLPVSQSFAQFSTPNLGDNTLDDGEYNDNSYDGNCTTYRVVWDNDSLYIAVSTCANFSNDAINIFIDTGIATPVNSEDGSDIGPGFDGVITHLPFNADFFAFVKKNYDRWLIFDGTVWNGGGENELLKDDHNSDNNLEVRIPWDDITSGNGRPASFNFLIYLTYENAKFHSIPYPNSNGSPYNDFYYFHVPNTNDDHHASPFTHTCFTQFAGDLDYGYNNSLPIPLYDLTVNRGSGQTGEARLFIDNDITILHDLYIGSEGRLQPGGGTSTKITMSGAFPNFGNIYNFGYLETIPDLGNTTGERLALEISGNTILRSNGGLGASRTKFADITIHPGASLDADNAGILDAELQFGTLKNAGVFDMGSGLTGFVNWTLRGITDNYYNLEIGSNPTIFHGLIIGNNSALHTIGNSEISIGKDFEIHGSLPASNELNIKLASAPGIDQTIKTFSQNPVHISGMDIASGGDVHFWHDGADPPVFEIHNSFKLTSGRLFTLDEANTKKFRVVIKKDATMDLSGVTSGYTSPPARPCFVDGPITIEYFDQGDRTFPIGKGQNYRPMEYEVEADPSDGEFEITAEHFHASAEAFNMTKPTDPEAILNVSEIRYSTLSVNLPINIESDKLTFQYGDNDDTDGITSDEHIRLISGEYDNFGIWITISNEGVGGNSGRISTGSNGFGFAPAGMGGAINYITLGNVQEGANPLPVTWLGFWGESAGKANVLHWATASESDNDYFEVEHSTDNNTFIAIGRVNSLHSTTHSKSTYSFSDDDATPGLSYYRLRQVDNDGAYGYSETIAIRQENGLRCYPNPFRDMITIETGVPEKAKHLTIRDLKGCFIDRFSFSDERASYPTSHLGGGVYIAELRTEGKNPVYFKLVK